MKRFSFLIILFFFSLCSFGQVTGGNGNKNEKTNTTSVVKRNEMSVQLSTMNYLAVDYERLVSNRFGLSIGALMLGGEISCKYHFKPQINSSSVGVKLGIDYNPGNYETSIPKIGLFYELRCKKILTAKVEVGYRHFTYTEDGWDQWGMTTTYIPDNGLYGGLTLGIFIPW